MSRHWKINILQIWHEIIQLTATWNFCYNKLQRFWSIYHQSCQQVIEVWHEHVYKNMMYLPISSLINSIRRCRLFGLQLAIYLRTEGITVINFKARGEGEGEEKPPSPIHREIRGYRRRKTGIRGCATQERNPSPSSNWMECVALFAWSPGWTLRSFTLAAFLRVSAWPQCSMLFDISQASVRYYVARTSGSSVFCSMQVTTGRFLKWTSAPCEYVNRRLYRRWLIAIWGEFTSLLRMNYTILFFCVLRTNFRSCAVAHRVDSVFTFRLRNMCDKDGQLPRLSGGDNANGTFCFCWNFLCIL